MKKFKITVDPRRVGSKPNEKWSKLITSYLTLQTGLTINEFAEIVSPPNSFTWSGGLFNGTRSNDRWKEQSVFGLDFDKGTTTIDEVYSKFKEFEITPQLWYPSFSDSPSLRKFRVVIFLSDPITDVRIHEAIYKSFLSMFPDIDTKCKDASRCFFGGKGHNITSMDPIPTSTFIDSMSIQIYSSDSKSFRNVPLKSKYYSDMKTAQKQAALYYKYRNDQISANNEYQPQTTSIQGGEKITIDFEKARNKIKILDEFLKGTWLHHVELFGLATNLIHVKGGCLLMKKTMEEYNRKGLTHYTPNNFNILPYVKKVNYFSEPIYKFSPYPEDNDLYDIVSTTRDIRGYIEIIEPIQKIKLDESEKLLKMKYDEVIQKGETGKIYLFKLPTAIGKTESLVGTIATIALPTNDLKNEITERMKISHVTTPDPVTFEDKSINQRLQYYYSIGLPKKAMEIIHHISENPTLYSLSDVQIASQYLSDINESIHSSDTILTTHKRALFTKFGHDTLIFDEDPINSLLEIKEMKIPDLYGLSLLSGKNELEIVCEHLKSSTEFEIKKTPTFSFDIDELIDGVSATGMESNVFEFFNSSFYIRTDKKSVYYVVKRNLPEKKKIIIMSATIPIYIYQKLFGDRVEVIDIGDVEQTGTITQHTRLSCSRNGLNRYVSTISDEVESTPVITFKSFGDHFQKPVKEMYFGNCSGYDTLKGKDIAVVGTPHRNNSQYFLIAKVIGIDFKTTDTTMSYQKIEYNGFRFKFNCFDNEELRQIQLPLIETDLIQAVGRARTLRTNAHVDLYSNFPLRISDEFKY